MVVVGFKVESKGLRTGSDLEEMMVFSLLLPAEDLGLRLWN